MHHNGNWRHPDSLEWAIRNPIQSSFGVMSPDMNRISLHVAKCACHLVAILLPLASVEARAEVILSEIMYDPQNADTNREWVELFNTGTSPVSLSGWQFGLPTNNLWTT